MLAKQNWLTAHADTLGKNKLPNIFDENTIDGLHQEKFITKELQDWSRKMLDGVPFVLPEGKFRDLNVVHISFSQCFNCDYLAVWICERLIYPLNGEAPAANPDLPAEIRKDYDEASVILNQSPRGAAALLRLCIQKLCKELGQAGKNINDDIGALVKAGLSQQIQQALDVVRVVGNSAVHPGQIDLRDDRATAESLFLLLNLIVEKTISEPRQIRSMFDALPATARQAIASRDGNPSIK